MNKDFWDARYASNEYAYGREPNVLLKDFLRNKSLGRILFPAEGEGRNAVFAALLGWEVHAFDISEYGKQKAESFAKEKDVKITYVLSSFENYAKPQNYFDCIAMIFSHLPHETRKTDFRKLLDFLKPGGYLFLTGFSSEQLGKSSGGPKDLKMLFAKEQLVEDFNGMQDVLIEEMEMDLDEGPFHQGNACIIQMIAKK